MPDTKKTAPVEADAPAEVDTSLHEVQLTFNGNTFSVQAKSKAEGERIIRAHIAAHSTDPTPAE